MLTKQQIRTLATKLQTTEHNIAQEYCQHLFLSILYQQLESKNIFFKGGTALRIVFNSPRFSEDLDFSSNLSVKSLQTLLEKVVKKMENFGLKIKITESKPTSGGFLAILNCAFLDFSIDLQLEVSKRKKTGLVGEIFTINSEFIPAYTIFNLKTEQMIEEKIEATLTRQKPRDFFDLYFLLRSRLIKPSQKKKLFKIKELIPKYQINFSRELKQFLPISFHPIIKNFKKTLLNEIDRHI